MQPARSCLFVPGDRPDRFANALSSGTDAVVLKGRKVDKPVIERARLVLARAANKT